MQLIHVGLNINCQIFKCRKPLIAARREIVLLIYIFISTGCYKYIYSTVTGPIAIALRKAAPLYSLIRAHIKLLDSRSRTLILLLFLDVLDKINSRASSHLRMIFAG